MSANARAIILLIAALMVFGGALSAFEGHGGGIATLCVGVVIAASVAFERRYGRPGQESHAVSTDWQRTSERFIDDETGQALEVWMDPLTGERRYEPIGSDPRLPKP